MVTATSNQIKGMDFADKVVYLHQVTKFSTKLFVLVIAFLISMVLVVLAQVKV